ncbi:MAG: STM4014 family protein [Pseudomonadales bacterium]|nr:STM4014 family protein [Pseudomonadales bacterium]
MAYTRLGWLLIGHPEHPRITGFRAALAEHTRDPVAVLSYQEILHAIPTLHDQLVSRLKKLDVDTIVIRIDSPGEHFGVEKQLIALGAKYPNARLSSTQAMALEPDPGCIRYMREWYRGFKTLLDQLQHAAEHAASYLGKPVRFFNAPEDIVLMFDKLRCQSALRDAGLTVPKHLPEVADHEALRAQMQQLRCYRVFIKPRHGSSASGVLSYQIKPDGSAEILSGALEWVNTKGKAVLYNSLHVHRYTEGQQINQIIDYILAEGAFVEHWIPKAQHQGKSFDIRVLTVQREVCHSLLRLSHSPLTNLHLGNQRLTIDEAHFAPQVIEALSQSAQSVAEHFPDSFTLGIDILLSSRRLKPYILEVNAFGDHLHNIRHRGLNPQQLQISKWYTATHANH